MGYVVGVDLGTTYAAAAIGRSDRVEVATLGTRAPSIPSVIVVSPDGAVLVGEAAERRALAEPASAAREFKRRLGDPVPLLVAGEPRTPEWLMGELLRWILDRVTEAEGARPDHVVVTHPANWGPFKTDLLRAAIAGLDLPSVDLLTEPEAAAVHYAGLGRVEVGSAVAVYDLGGGTFDAAVVRRSAEGFSLLGTPEGMERFGGIDLDHAVSVHVRDALGGLLDDLDHTDPAVAAGLARLRDDCRAAKEALSTDTDVAIPVSLPGVQTEVRLVRAELEAMVRPRLVETVDALERTVRSAGLELADLGAVLLVGGASRMPLVADVVRDRTGRPVAVDAHPKHAVALGAAQVALRSLGQDAPAEVPPAPPPPPAPAPAAAPVAADAPVRRSRSFVPVLLVGLAVFVALVVGGVMLMGDDDGTPDEVVQPPSTDQPDTSSEGYPDGATDGFVQLCTDQGVSAAACSCVADGMPSVRSYESFTAFESELRADPAMELPADIAALFDRCST